MQHLDRRILPVNGSLALPIGYNGRIIAKHLALGEKRRWQEKNKE
jgi:hypothetical protein